MVFQNDLIQLLQYYPAGGVNIAQAFVRDPSIVEFVAEQGVRFVTTSAGSPTKYTKALKQAGLTVYHVVPTLRTALKAVDAGVDGLVVEGGEDRGERRRVSLDTAIAAPPASCRRWPCSLSGQDFPLGRRSVRRD